MDTLYGQGRITQYDVNTAARAVVPVMESVSLALTVHEAGQSGLIRQRKSSFTLLRGHLT